jgi:hypothetical protein
MSTGDGYREDLAAIHDAEYGTLAREAGGRLLDALARGRHSTGTIIDLGCGSGILTTFRRIGALYRRDEEVHRPTLLDPAAVESALRAVGFEVEVIPGYGTTPLPPGLIAFLARKP